MQFIRTFQIEVQQTATFFMVSNLWKTPRVCPAAGRVAPKSDTSNTTRIPLLWDSPRLIIFVLSCINN